MKKLLTLLGSLGLVATTGVTTIACGDKKDEGITKTINLGEITLNKDDFPDENILLTNLFKAKFADLFAPSNNENTNDQDNKKIEDHKTEINNAIKEAFQKNNLAYDNNWNKLINFDAAFMVSGKNVPIKIKPNGEIIDDTNTYKYDAITKLITNFKIKDTNKQILHIEFNFTLKKAK
ncbi:lipoprotein [Spiroplasma endosymbiont of Crioceris asparagi]|uniref:lipoprotein n=1 Tax=Spiroplasma endosymbiont of Crioceris asparagi TaxID=3066286 RepID=UPI0030D40223